MTAKDHFAIGVRWMGIACIVLCLGYGVPNLVLLLTIDRDPTGLQPFWYAALATGVWGVAGFVLLWSARRIADRLFPPDDVERAFGEGAPDSAVALESGSGMFVAGRKLLGIVALLLAVYPSTYAVGGIGSWSRFNTSYALSATIFLVFGIVLIVGPSRVGGGLRAWARGRSPRP